MKKTRGVILVLVLVALCAGGGFYLLNRTAPEEQNPFPIPVDKTELLTSSTEGYNSVEVYRQSHRLVINAQSEAAFFDGAQFLVETQGAIQPSDVEILWTTLGGGTEKTADNDRIIAEIKIRENGTLIFDKKVNFMKKAFDAVEDMLEKNQ